MLEGFAHRTVATSAAQFHVAVGGAGPPLLLVHGYPQTHLAWHRIAPALAHEFTVVAPDLRGYGRSRITIAESGPEAFSKRAMAVDQVEVMHGLGFERFAVIGHDRGARVGYRLGLARPEKVSGFAPLTLICTISVCE